jgi:large subunit ribosomal protein L2
MALRTFRPTSPGLRHLVLVDRGSLWKGGPVKMLTEGKTKTGGRNNDGRITTRHIGGGHKQSYRLVDFRAASTTCGGGAARMIRTAAPTLTARGRQLSYILPPAAPAGDQVAGESRREAGQRNAAVGVPIGTIVHNVEMKPGRGGQIARSAGSFVQLVGRDAGWAVLKLNSGETRRVRADCMATVGAVSNPDHSNQVTGKAGRMRWKGRRPTVRSIAMNPVDHPNGGRTKGGKHWATHWGKPTKGFKTRKNKATDKYIVRSRQLKK